MTQKDIQKTVKSYLSIDATWQKRAVVVLYNLQTRSEQNSGETTEHNGKGFSGYDAPILTPIAQKVKSGQSLSYKDHLTLSRMLPKYWKQIASVSDQEKLNLIVSATGNIAKRT